MIKNIKESEAEIADLEIQRTHTKPQEASDMDKVHAYVRYYLEHLDQLLLHYDNPVLQAKYFGVIFNEAPTYTDIVSGTPDISRITGVNTIFTTKDPKNKLYGWHDLPLIKQFRPDLDP